MMASLAHRVSGLMLIVFIVAYPCLLAVMLGGPEGFARAREALTSPLGRLFLWASGAALAYHWFNGLRFLLLDAGFGESREAMRTSAKLALGAGVAAALGLGAALWTMGGG